MADFTRDQATGFNQESATSDLYNNTVPDDDDQVDHGGDPKSGISNQPAPS